MDRDELILDMLEHFHEDAINYGGWPIHVKTLEEALFINDEFKGVLKAMEDKPVAKFLVKRVKGSEFKKKHTILVLREKADSYKQEADRLYHGLKKLVEGP